MAIHPAFADRFYLLDGIPSIQAAMADPELDRRMREYMEPPLGPVPDVATRDLTVDGPHGPVPVRVYEPADAAEPTARPCSGCTAAPSCSATWTCPRPTSPRARSALAPGRSW